MPVVVHVSLNKNLYLRDPVETDLGKRIVSAAIRLIDELGFERFNFKKLAQAVETTEASIYRYFESKHQLLTYLLSWYWSWLEYLVTTRNAHQKTPRDRLLVVLQVLTELAHDSSATPHVDRVALHRIIVEEASKAYVTSRFEADMEAGLFECYESFCKKGADIIKEYNPKYRYPMALMTTIIWTVQRQTFNITHFHAVTELKSKKGDNSEVKRFLEDLVFSVLDAKR